MSVIERIASKTPWEPVFGYSRTVRAGDWLAISGTTATDERGLIVGVGQMYVQTRQTLLNIKTHLERAGFTLANIVRTRVFTTDISRFAEIARAHKEVLGETPPAATLIEVSGFVHPDMLVEIEVDAWRGSDQAIPESEAPAARKPTPKRRATAKPKPKAMAASKGRARPRTSRSRKRTRK